MKTIHIQKIHIMAETKRCPYCGEEIMATAKKCKHCGEWLDGSEHGSNSRPNYRPAVVEPVEVNKIDIPYSRTFILVGFILAVLGNFLSGFQNDWIKEVEISIMKIDLTNLMHFFADIPALIPTCIEVVGSCMLLWAFLKGVQLLKAPLLNPLVAYIALNITSLCFSLMMEDLGDSVGFFVIFLILFVAYLFLEFYIGWKLKACYAGKLRTIGWLFITLGIIDSLYILLYMFVEDTTSLVFVFLGSFCLLLYAYFYAKLGDITGFLSEKTQDISLKVISVLAFIVLVCGIIGSTSSSHRTRSSESSEVLDDGEEATDDEEKYAEGEVTETGTTRNKSDEYEELLFNIGNDNYIQSSASDLEMGNTQILKGDINGDGEEGERILLRYRQGMLNITYFAAEGNNASDASILTNTGHWEFLDEYGGLPSDYYAQVSIIDLNGDGINEVVTSVGDKASDMYTNIYKFVGNDLEFAGWIGGQRQMIFDNGNIVSPYGGQGLASAYTFDGDNIVEKGDFQYYVY